MLSWTSMVGIPSDDTSNIPWFLKNYPLWLWDQSTSSLHILGQSYLDLKTNLVEGGLNTCAELSFTFKGLQSKRSMIIPSDFHLMLQDEAMEKAFVTLNIFNYYTQPPGEKLLFLISGHFTSFS